jgi:hypothetical protein
MKELKEIFLGLVGHKNKEELQKIYVVAENNQINRDVVDGIINQVHANPTLMKVRLQVKAGQIKNGQTSLEELLNELIDAGVSVHKEKYLSLIG